MAEYSYDEQGYNFCYFLLSVLSLVLVPVTAHSVYKTFQSFSKCQTQSTPLHSTPP